MSHSLTPAVAGTLQPKTAASSETTLSSLMMPEHANPYQVVHGGVIMKIMDNTGGAVAHRHAESKVVTARVDEMKFLAPVRIGSLVSCHGRLTFVGSSSMEVAVTLTAEGLTSKQPLQTMATAYFIFVALDEHDQPRPVPPLELVSEEERRAFAAGKQRYLTYKNRQRTADLTR
ncbi:MAG: acyl-CoA thioesterase [Sporomusaceae bacterium]|nr:acyl-CoA thioesterase [Sporomusaceae bacterium]